MWFQTIFNARPLRFSSPGVCCTHVVFCRPSAPCPEYTHCLYTCTLGTMYSLLHRCAGIRVPTCIYIHTEAPAYTHAHDVYACQYRLAHIHNCMHVHMHDARIHAPHHHHTHICVCAYPRWYVALVAGHLISLCAPCTDAHLNARPSI